MKKSELFAVSQFLVDWPESLSFEDILDAIYQRKDQEITYWAMVSKWSRDDICESIESCELSFSRAVADILNEQKNPVPHDAINAHFGDVMHQVNSLSIFAK